MRAPKLPLCRAIALPMNRHFSYLKGAFFPFEGVYLRHLDWLSVNVILEAKSPSSGRSGLGLALNERPGLYHSYEPSFESLRRKTRLLLHINHIYEGTKSPLCSAIASLMNSV